MATNQKNKDLYLHINSNNNKTLNKVSNNLPATLQMIIMRWQC